MFNISGIKKLAEEKVVEIEARLTLIENDIKEILKILKEKK